MISEKSYEVRVTSIGRDRYQCFIENVSSPAHYVRLIFGVTEYICGSRRTKILGEWIVTMDKTESGAFLGEFDSKSLKNRRLWVLFEAVERQPKHRKGKPIAR